MLFFNVVELAVAAVAGDNDQIDARGLDLVHLLPAIVDALRVIARDQSAPAAAAAELTAPGRIQIDPLFNALAQDPPGLFIISVAEKLFRPPPVIAGVMVGDNALDLCAVKPDAALLDVFDKEIENRIGAELCKCLGIPLFKTRPGRKVGVPSFRPQQVPGLEPLHVVHNAAGHCFHGVVIACKISPACAFPVF